MKNVYLLRMVSSDQGTEGILAIDDFSCKTIELPWKNNHPNISCIPTGTYDVIIRQSPHFGKIYWVRNVPNRHWVLMHPGNWAGDTSKGYKSNVEGCILLGMHSGVLANQRAVLNSRVAVKRFMRYMNYNPFKLTIIGGEGE